MSKKAKFTTSAQKVFKAFVLKRSKLSQAKQNRLFKAFESFLAWKKSYESLSAADLKAFSKKNKVSTEIKNEILKFLKKCDCSEVQVFFQDFLLKLEKDGVSEKTIRNYRSDIKQFISFSKVSKIKDLVLEVKLNNFVSDQQDKDLKESSINRKISSITRFVQFIEENRLVAHDLTWLTEHNYEMPHRNPKSEILNPKLNSEILNSKSDSRSVRQLADQDSGLMSQDTQYEIRDTRYDNRDSLLVTRNSGLNDRLEEYLTNLDKKAETEPEGFRYNLSTGKAQKVEPKIGFDAARVDHQDLSEEQKFIQNQTAQMKYLKKANFLQTALMVLGLIFFFSFAQMADFANQQLDRTNPNSLASKIVRYAPRPWAWFSNQDENDNYLAQTSTETGAVLGAKEDLATSKLIFHIPTNFNAVVEALGLIVNENLNVAGDTVLTGDTNVQANLDVNGDANVDGNLTVAGTSVLTGATTINGAVTIAGDINADGVNIDLGSGELTASNVVNTITAGDGITVSGTQEVTIGIDDDYNLENLSIFSSINANGTTITAGSNEDELILATSGDLTISASGKTITFGATNSAGWTDNGTTVSLTTLTDWVGIGTASPVTQLQVGAGTPSSVSGADDAFITGDLEVAGTIYGSITGSISTGFDEGSVVFTDSSGDLASDSDNFYWDDSNNYLGIGTSSPTSNLTVDGTANITGNFTVNSNSLFVNASTNRVGIGTGSPDNTLHVAGDVKIETLSPGATNTVLTHSGGVIETRTIDSKVWGSSLVDYSGSSNATYLAYFTDNDTLTASSLFMSGSSIGLGTTSPTYSFDVYHATDDMLAQFESGDTLAGIQITDSSNSAYFLTQDSVASIGLTNSLSTSNISINSSGYLGIGNTNPVIGLHVGSGTPGNVTAANDAYVTGDLEVDGVIYGSIAGSINPGLTTGSVVFIGSSGNLVEDNDNFYWDDNNNYLGLGTSSPSSRLDVAGTAAATTFTDGTIIISSGTVNLSTNTIYDGNFTGDWAWNNGNLSGIADIDATTGTIATLDGTSLSFTSGSIGNISFANNDISASNDSGINIYDNASNGLSIADGGNASFSNDLTVDNNTLYVDSTQHFVGVGTTSPSTALEVNGTATVTTLTDGTASLNSGILDLGTNTIYDGNFTGDWNFNNGSVSGIYDLSVNHNLTVNESSLFVDADTGFVGVGTTSPDAQFNINALATSGTIFNFAYGSATTLDGDTIGARFNMDDGNVTATNQNVTGLNIKLPTVTNTHTSGTKTLRGFYVDFGTGSGINQNGAGGTTEYNAAEFVLPSLTQTAGTLLVNGLKVSTPTSITTGGTASAINISPSGINAGTLYGMQIGNITAGAGSEIAYYVGTGWDSILTMGNTTIINGSGVTQEAGGGTGQSNYDQGDLLYASASDTLSRLSIGNTTGYVLTVGAGGVPAWGVVSGSACTNCLVSDPSSNQIITPTGDTTGLSVRQTATGSPSADIFSITNNAGDTKYLYVDSSGTVYIPNLGSESSADQITITPSSNKFALKLVGSNVTDQNLQIIDSYNTSGTIFDMGYASATSLAGSLVGLDLDLDTNLTVTNQDVTTQKITMPDFTNTHTSGTHYYYGLQITPAVGAGLNQNGAGGTSVYNLLDLTMPALTQTAGTLTSYGIDLTTPSSITTGGTAYGININPTGIANGYLRGVSIGSITPGSGSEIASYIGTGWDYGVYSATAGDNYFAGNVGIGTTDPDTGLHVVGTDVFIAGDSGYTFNNPSGDEDLYVQGNLEVDGTIYANITGSITIGDTQGAVLFMDAGGDITSDYGNFYFDDSNNRLGLGTTSPSYRLDVNSSTTDAVARFSSSDDLAQILISDNDTTSYINSKDSTLSLGLTSGLSSSNLNITSAGSVGIGLTNPTAKLGILSTNTQLRLSYDTTHYTNFTVGSDGSLVLAPNGTTAMTIRDSKITSHVPHEFLASGDVSMAYDLIMTNQTSSSIESYGPLSLIAGESYESNDLTLTTYNYGDVVLNMEDGNLVIGATSPSIVFNNSTAGETDFWMGIIGIGDTSDNDKLSIGDGSTPGSNSYLTIDTSGQVGIGTTSPAYNLEVYDATDDFLTEFQSGDALAGIQLTDNSDTAYLLTQDSTLSIGMTNSLSNSNVNINSSGYLGIGATNPTTPLHVVAASGDIATFDNGAGSGCTLSDGGVISCSSDINLKKNVESIDETALDKVLSLNPVLYNWKTQEDGESKQAGFIAQEVETVFPDLVRDGISGYKSLNTVGMIPYLTLALQQLDAEFRMQDEEYSDQFISYNEQLTNLDARVTSNESSTSDLNSRYSLLDTRISEIERELTLSKDEVSLLKTELENTQNSLAESIATQQISIENLSDQTALAISNSSSSEVTAKMSNLSNLPQASVLELQLGNTTPSIDQSYIKFTNDAGDVIGSITGNDTGGVTYNTSGADFAEYFPKVDPDEKLEPGDIVCLHEFGGVQKCGENISPTGGETLDETERVQRREGNGTIIGVVSEHAGFVGNSEYADSPNYVLVGILGQLPVRVSSSATDIKANDPITVGPDGAAVKAETAGYIVGRAIESSDFVIPNLARNLQNQDEQNTEILKPVQDDQHFVLVYVNASYYIGSLSANGELKSGSETLSPSGDQKPSPSGEGTLADAREGEANLFASLEASLKESLGEDPDENHLLAMQDEIDYLKKQIIELTQKIEESELPSQTTDVVISTNVERSNSDSSTTLGMTEKNQEQTAVLGASTSLFTDLGSSLYTDKALQVGKLTLGGETGNMINSVETLEIQPYGTAGVNFVAGLVSIDEDGNVSITGDLTVSGSVKTNKLQINSGKQNPSSLILDSASGSSLGSAVIPAGETAVIIPTTAFSADSKVFTSLTSSSGGQSLVILRPELNTCHSEFSSESLWCQSIHDLDDEILKQVQDDIKSGVPVFVVKIDHAHNQDINFDWWIVDSITPQI